MGVLFIVEKSKHVARRKKKKERNANLDPQQILSITNLNFYYLDVCVYIFMYIYTPKN